MTCMPATALLLLAATTPGQKDITFSTSDGAHIQARLFSSTQKQVVVFAHGAVFNKESWYPLAERLQKEGIASLPFDFRGYGKSQGAGSKDLYRDILGAVSFLETQGYTRIGLVGGSMGGGAVLQALAHTQDPKIDSAILLAPASGPPIKNPKVRKLFIVSEGDPHRTDVTALSRASSSPSVLRLLPGEAHAQHIFQTGEGHELTELIVQFLKGQLAGS